MNDALAALLPHPSRRISEQVACDPNALDLTVGVPRHGPPEPLREALRELIEGAGEWATGHDLYAPARGTESLRAAIAAMYARTYGLEVDPDREVLVTHGGAEALWLAVFAATNPGDAVVIGDPCYMLYAPIATSLGRRVVRVPTSGADGFRLDPERVRAALGERARVVLVNSPANPTGVVVPSTELAELARICARRGAVLVHDEVLDRYTAAGPHVPARAAAPQAGAVLVNSLSKRFGMTGWRIGWLVGDAAFVAEATKAHTFMTLAVNHAVQDAAARALAMPALDADVERHAATIAADGAWLAEQLRRIRGLERAAAPAHGGLYLFIDVRELAARLDPHGHGPAGIRVASHLLDRARVAVVPGEAFGERGRDHVRLSFGGGRDLLRAAVQRLQALEPAR